MPEMTDEQKLRAEIAAKILAAMIIRDEKYNDNAADAILCQKANKWARVLLHYVKA